MFKGILILLGCLGAASHAAAQTVTETPRTITYSKTTTTRAILPNGGSSTTTTFEERGKSNRIVTNNGTTSSYSYSRGRGRGGLGNCNAQGCTRRTGAYVNVSDGSYRDTIRGDFSREYNRVGVGGYANPSVRPAEISQNSQVIRSQNMRPVVTSFNSQVIQQQNARPQPINPYPFR